jgi:hypothetical protein
MLELPEDLIDFDPEWIAVQRFIKDRFGIKPDLHGILFAIGLQELGQVKDKFKKEEKQDLMHIAVCKLLCEEGWYEFLGRDEDGWPHYVALSEIPALTVKEQEQLLKRQIIRYFAELRS